MEISMKQVDGLISLFRKEQHAKGFREYGNVVQLKWDIRTIAQGMDSMKEMTQLVKFFFLYTETGQIKEFIERYESYYETMVRVKRDRLHRRYLQQQTLAAAKAKEEQVEPRSESS